MTLAEVLTVSLAVLLAWAGGAKLRAPQVAARAARLPDAAARALGLVELTVAVALVVPPARAAAGAAAAILGVAFLAWAGAVRVRGVHRIACGCFGSTREVPVAAVAARAVVVVLAGLGVAVGVGGRIEPSTHQFLTAAVAVLAVAVAALTVLVLALYRQVGVLHRRLGPRSALEVPEEGPAVGSAAPPLEGLLGAGSELAVFSSPGCRLCHELRPGLRAIVRDGQRVLEVSEADRPDDFDRYGVPGTRLSCTLWTVGSRRRGW